MKTLQLIIGLALVAAPGARGEKEVEIRGKVFLALERGDAIKLALARVYLVDEEEVKKINSERQPRNERLDAAHEAEMSALEAKLATLKGREALAVMERRQELLEKRLGELSLNPYVPAEGMAPDAITDADGAFAVQPRAGDRYMLVWGKAMGATFVWLVDFQDLPEGDLLLSNHNVTADSRPPEVQSP